MKYYFLLFLFLSHSLKSAPEPPQPHEVVVLYNSNLKESQSLAQFYAEKRNIPAANLVGLPLSDQPQLTRSEYETTLLEPLKARFNQEQWWEKGITKAERNRIKVLVCVKGVPYKIQRLTIKNAQGEVIKGPLQKIANEASVDSELSLMGDFTYPAAGYQPNPYYKKDHPFKALSAPTMLMVGRIDAPKDETCRRMINDAIYAEEKGLWGACYLDEAHKGGGYTKGDQWLKRIHKLNQLKGIPSIVDRNSNVFTHHYPMQNAAYYYGWYSHHRSGPFLNPKLQFPRGAIAIHIHSYSAKIIHSAKRHWVGPILEAGACATVGNVYEPYLDFTHHLDILHDRLLKGYTFIEAAYMSYSSLSWQGVVLGDPLYRPGAQFSHKKSFKPKEYWEFKALRLAALTWEQEPAKQEKKIQATAERKKSAILYETLGLRSVSKGNFKDALEAFQQASKHTSDPVMKLRLQLHEVEMLRRTQRKEDAIRLLQQLRQQYSEIPEHMAVVGLLNILDPPPPPPVTPESGEPKKKTPPSKK